MLRAKFRKDVSNRHSDLLALKLRHDDWKKQNKTNRIVLRQAVRSDGHASERVVQLHWTLGRQEPQGSQLTPMHDPRTGFVYKESN